MFSPTEFQFIFNIIYALILPMISDLNNGELPHASIQYFKKHT